MMARRHPAPGKRRTQYGFTFVELLIYMLVAGIVMGSVYQLLMGQSRAYTKQRELMDVHETLRSAAALLAWEMRQSWAAGGDLYSINANSIALRSTQGTGIVCVLHSTQPRFGLRGVWLDDLAATTDDSALVYVWSNWKVVRINWAAVYAPPTATCGWAGSGKPDKGVEFTVNVPNDTAGIRIGTLIRAFRRVEYGLYQDAGDGRWWLGRKVGAAASYEKLTGPLLPPASGGLVLTYRDAAGNVTADPTQVAVIDFVLRAESYGVSSDALEFQQDTLATRVALRG